MRALAPLVFRSYMSLSNCTSVAIHRQIRDRARVTKENDTLPLRVLAELVMRM